MGSLRRLPAAGALAATVLLVAVACGTDDEPTGNPDGGIAGTELTVWSMWSEGEPGQVLLDGAVRDFEEETGVEVTVEWQGRSGWQALLPTLNTDDPPADVIESSDGGILRNLGPTEEMLDLTSVWDGAAPDSDGTVSELLGTSYENKATTVDGVPLMVPYSASSTSFFYNAARFPELEANPPQTWDDFFAILDEQTAQGRQPLALDGSLNGYNGLYSIYFIRAAVGGDEDPFDKAALDRTGQTWLEPGYLEAAQQIEKLAKGGYFIDGYDSSQFPAMQLKWANDESDFILMGTWLPTEVRPSAAEGFEFKSFAFPTLGDNPPPKANLDLIGFGIVKKSKNVEAAEAFVTHLLTTKYQEQMAATTGTIPVRSDVSSSDELTSAKSQIDEGEVYSASVPAERTDYLTTVLYPLNDELIFGKITAEEFIDRIAADSAAYWEAQG